MDWRGASVREKRSNQNQIVKSVKRSNAIFPASIHRHCVSYHRDGERLYKLDSAKVQ